MPEEKKHPEFSDKDPACAPCSGTGRVVRFVGERQETVECPSCGGAGRVKE